MDKRYVSYQDEHGVSNAERWHYNPDCGSLVRSKVREVTENEIEWHELEACKNCASDTWSESEMDSKFPDRVNEMIDNINSEMEV